MKCRRAPWRSSARTACAQTVEARRRSARPRRARRHLPARHQGPRAGAQYVAQGRTLILIGHAGHPEVEGTIGQIPGTVLLVQSEAEVEQLDLPVDTPLAYVTQTTLSVDDTRGIIDALQRRFTDIVGPDTRDICYATQNRQARGARVEQAGRRAAGGRRNE